jgi:DnaJ-class molecular chaperone
MLRSRMELGPEAEPAENREKCGTCKGTGETLAAACDACGFTEIETWQYDFGRSAETGHSDSGTRAKCLTCGESGDVGDFEYKERCLDCDGTGREPKWDDREDYDPEEVA